MPRNSGISCTLFSVSFEPALMVAANTAHVAWLDSRLNWVCSSRAHGLYVHIGVPFQSMPDGVAESLTVVNHYRGGRENP